MTRRGHTHPRQTMLLHWRSVRVMTRGGSTTAVDDVSFLPPIGPPRNDAEVERSVQIIEGNPWGPWTKHKQ